MHQYEVRFIQGVPDYKVLSFSEEKSSFALVIPVLNENGRLIEQLRKIQENKVQIDIIIADGRSTDGSTDENLLKKQGVNTLLTIVGRGKLSAQLRMGIHFCLQRSYQGIITMDGNGKDEIEGINRILREIEGGFDFIQGSRFLQVGDSINTPKLRHLAIKYLHAPITSLASGFKFTDTTNGFRGHSRRLLLDQNIAPLRDIFQTYELIAYLPIRASNLKYKVKETPVKRAYSTVKGKQTKIVGIKAHMVLFIILIKASVRLYNPKNVRSRVRK